MTIEEIKNMPDLVDFMLNESVIADSRKTLRKRMDETCNLAIKALEQKPVIDKIRAEIESHCGLAKEYDCECCPYCRNLMGVREALEIIDKYKYESGGG